MYIVIPFLQLKVIDKLHFRLYYLFITMVIHQRVVLLEDFKKALAKASVFLHSYIQKYIMK